MQIGRGFLMINQVDSAEYYAHLLEICVQKYGHLSPDLTENSYVLGGEIALRQKDYDKALRYFRLAHYELGRAQVFVETGPRDSVVFYRLIALEKGQMGEIPGIVLVAARLLARHFADTDPKKANQYLNLYLETNEKLYSTERIKQAEQISLTEEQATFDLQQKEDAYRNRLILLGLLSAFLISAIISIVLWQSNRYRRKANEKPNRAYRELTSTQAQLIQSEKLASLGELTAGIAHEIQNPLNFVNNFSELNRELIAEMEEEIEKGNLSEVKLIATDLAANEEKINHHGQRASGIVKSMLEHSRTSTGTKEPTDLNALADEYLRLAYHGLRAKDSNFNAKYELIADPDLPKVNVVPQDIGRVLLNLISNAFYAVHQRNTEGGTGHHVETGHALSLQPQQPPQQRPPYQPTVTISTQKIDNHIVITVKDNGNGIPESIKDKIFQPFFTTKPTGQGTGLGLSLAYDMVVKGHGGTIQVEANENSGTTFIIQLSIN